MHRQKKHHHQFFAFSVFLFFGSLLVSFFTQTMLKSQNMSLVKEKSLLVYEIEKTKKTIADTRVVVDGLANRERLEQVASEDGITNNEKNVVMIP